MSAMPPIAIKFCSAAKCRDVRMCDIEANPIRWLFNHLAGAAKERQGHGTARNT